MLARFINSAPSFLIKRRNAERSGADGGAARMASSIGRTRAVSSRVQCRGSLPPNTVSTVYAMA